MARRVRYVLYSLLVTAAALWALNAGVELLEHKGFIDTWRPDEAAVYVDDGLFEVRGKQVRTSRAAERKLSPSRFRGEAPGWRAFVLGGSFIWGLPWSEAGVHDDGSLPFWLRKELGARHRGPVEVINLAASGVPSHWVRRQASEALRFDPDVLIVASCNNEGGPEPSAVRQRLHQLGGYRLLSNLLQADVTTDRRRSMVLPDPEVDALRQRFRANLEAVASEATAAGVPVLLATLPANFRYDRMEFVPGLPGIVDEAQRESGCAVAGYMQAYRRDFEAAERTFAGCRDVPEVAQWLALRALQTGRPAPQPNPLVDRWGACVAGGIEAHYAGDHAAAIEHLSQCGGNAPEALRWIGLAQLDAGLLEEATTTLEQSIEVFPRVRCRPSFNRVVREVAAAHPGVHLVDLDAASRARAPDGLPGSEQFVDNNHMTWAALAHMADEFLAVLDAQGLAPPNPRDKVLDRSKLAQDCELPPVPGSIEL